MTGTPPPKRRAFAIGDRVRVASDYFVSHLRDASGTVAVPDESVRGHISDGAYWVEFDNLCRDDTDGSLTEAGAIEGEDLVPV